MFCRSRLLGFVLVAVGGFGVATVPAIGQSTADADQSVDPQTAVGAGLDVRTASLRSGERAATEIRDRVQSAAKLRLEAAESGDAEALANVRAAEDQLIATAAAVQLAGAELDSLQFEQRDLTVAHRDARDRRDDNLVALYANGPLRGASDAVGGYNPVESRIRELMIATVFERDEDELVAAYVASLTAIDLTADATSRRVAEETLTQLRSTQRAAEYDAGEAASALAALAALPADVVFPISDSYNFVDTYLAPRMAGTASAHRHQGTDIFAPAGTPLIAMERGFVVRIGTIRLGGNRLWLIGESGTQYYYAHLQGFADVVEGEFVEAGTVVGFVGNTGNAISTPPHVHIQVHPNAGAAVNPFPLLRQLADRDTELIAAGSLPIGHPVVSAGEG